MARNKVDACMFCNQAPCECNKPKTKPKVTAPKLVKPAPTSPASPAPKPVPVARIKPSITAAKSIRTAPPGMASAVTVRPVNDAEDPVMRAAFTALAPLLHRDELIYHRSMFDLPPHKVDAMIWRRDHGQS